MTLTAMVVWVALAQAPVDAGVLPGPEPIEQAPPEEQAAPDEQATADAGVQALPPPPVVLAPPEDAPVDTALDEAEAVTLRVTLTDGQVLVGTLAGEASDAVTLRLGSGDELVLPRSAIRDLRREQRAYRTPSGATWFEDANRTRYFYGPSAMMLKQGEISFSQYELVISSLSYGLTDHVSLQVGGAVPAWFIPPLPQGFNLLVAAKAGFSATDLTHFALGAQVLAIPAVNTGGSGGLPVLGIVFGTVTYGQRDAHISLSAGMPFILSGPQPVGPVVGTLSGNYRVSETVALVTESWIVANLQLGSTTPSVLGVHGLMARIMGERIAADLGMLLAWEGGSGVVPFPIPWLAFTYNFL